VDAYFFTGKDHAAPWIQAGLIRDVKKVKEIMEASSGFAPVPKVEARARTGITETNVYLWVGHLNANKNPLMVVRAFERFIAEKTRDAALYMIFQSDQLLEEIKGLLAANPAVAAHIHLVGKVEHEELASWFSAADFFISGSFYEGSGIAVCEAMSCGCIPILTDIPSFRFMTGGLCGLLYAAGDEDSLLAALYESSKMNKVSGSQQTLRQFRERLSFEAIAGEIQELVSGL
jgi:glycosyltransferase involved in cell wall biosynthesis